MVNVLGKGKNKHPEQEWKHNFRDHSLQQEFAGPHAPSKRTTGHVYKPLRRTQCTCKASCLSAADQHPMQATPAVSELLIQKRSAERGLPERPIFRVTRNKATASSTHTQWCQPQMSRSPTQVFCDAPPLQSLAAAPTCPC